MKIQKISKNISPFAGVCFAKVSTYNYKMNHLRHKTNIAQIFSIHQNNPNANKFIIFFAIISFIIFCQKTCAQDNFGVKFFGISFHPKGEKDNSFLMPYKLDNNAYFVMNFGAELTYEKFLCKDIVSVKVVQALYADCAVKLGGFSHIGIRTKIFNIGKHSLFGGIVPTLVFRRNWQEINGYINPNRFKGDVDDKWQHLFLWYGGEFEYKYKISDRIDFSASFVPGYPDLMSLAFGVNLKLTSQ